MWSRQGAAGGDGFILYFASMTSCDEGDSLGGTSALLLATGEAWVLCLAIMLDAEVSTFKRHSGCRNAAIRCLFAAG